MTIGIDIRVLARGARTGVEEYTIDLLARLFDLDKSIQFKLFYNAYQKVFLKYPWLNLPNVELYDFKIPNRFLFISARYFNQPKIDRLLKGIDVYFGMKDSQLLKQNALFWKQIFQEPKEKK